MFVLVYFELLMFLLVVYFSCSKPLQNYMVFNDTDGVYTYTFEYERKVIPISYQKSYVPELLHICIQLSQLATCLFHLVHVGRLLLLLNSTCVC